MDTAIVCRWNTSEGRGGPLLWTTQQQSSNDGFLIYDTHTRKPVSPTPLKSSWRYTIPRRKNKTRHDITNVVILSICTVMNEIGMEKLLFMNNNTEMEGLGL